MDLRGLLDDAADRLGFPPGKLGAPRRGRVDEILVEIASDESIGSVRIAAHGHFPVGLVIAAETASTRIRGMLGDGDVRTGDAPFDRRILIRFERPALVLAALDYATRVALVRHFDEKGVVEGNRVLADVSRPEGIERIVGAARHAVDIARALSIEPAAIPGKLFDNTFDVQPGVRLANLRTLLADYPASEDAERGARTCLSDSDLDVRLTAALSSLSGERGRSLLRSLGEGRDVRLALRRIADDDAQTGTIREAARDALSRLGAAPAEGRLSLAPGDSAGAVSVATDGGEVSLKKPL